MPVFQFTDPSGQPHSIEGPEGATREQAFDMLQLRLANTDNRTDLQKGIADYGPITGGFAENALVGAGKAFTDIGRGIYQRFGGEVDVNQSRALDAPLMDTAGGLTGNIAGSVAALAPTMAVPGANTVAGAGVVGGLLGAMQPTAQDESVAMNAGLGLLGGAAGQKLGQVASKAAGGLLAGRTAAKAQNSARDAVIREGVEAGYVFDPNHTNPGLVASVGKGLSGKIATQQKAATINQSTTNRLAKQALGVADDAPITDDALKAIRSQHGQAYKAVTNAMDTFKIDDAHEAAISKIFKDYDTLVNEFGDDAINQSIEQTRRMIGKDSIDSKATMTLIKRLRKQAKGNFKKSGVVGDDEALQLGKIQSQSANALEELIERNLDDPSLVANFQNARREIAKTYTIEGALDATGNVDARKLGRALDKGLPLSGELETIGKVAQNFPEVVKRVTSSADPYSVLSTGFGGAGLAMGSPEMVALAASRPLARAALLSKPGQKALTVPSYNASSKEVLGGLLGTRYGQLGARTTGGLIGASQQ